MKASDSPSFWGVLSTREKESERPVGARQTDALLLTASCSSMLAFAGCVMAASSPSDRTRLVAPRLHRDSALHRRLELTISLHLAMLLYMLCDQILIGLSHLYSHNAVKPIIFYMLS